MNSIQYMKLNKDSLDNSEFDAYSLVGKTVTTRDGKTFVVNGYIKQIICGYMYRWSVCEYRDVYKQNLHPGKNQQGYVKTVVCGERAKLSDIVKTGPTPYLSDFNATYSAEMSY